MLLAKKCVIQQIYIRYRYSGFWYLNSNICLLTLSQFVLEKSTTFVTFSVSFFLTSLYSLVNTQPKLIFGQKRNKIIFLDRKWRKVIKKIVYNVERSHFSSGGVSSKNTLYWLTSLHTASHYIQCIDKKCEKPTGLV